MLQAAVSLSTNIPDGSTPLKVPVTSRVHIILGTTTIAALPRNALSDDVIHLKSVDINHSTLL